jgi:hypothetical protein
MRRYLQKFAHIIISLLLLLPLIPTITFSNDSLPKRRIVTLIYDDSGSMWTATNQQPIDNWKYANYALQSLVGLLDSNDELNVIPMSNPTELRSIRLEKRQRQNQMNMIKAWEGKKSTPIQTISTAIEEIKKRSIEQPHAEYWLIVLTDGVFVELDPNYKTNTKQSVLQVRKQTESNLKELTESMRLKDISFNSVIVTIESNLSAQHKDIMGDLKLLWYQSTNGTVIESDSEDKIVESINQVGALITNRDPDETKLFNLNARFKDNRVNLESPLPLRRITILHQTRKNGPAVGINDVILNGNKQPKLEGPFVIQSPSDPLRLSSDIKGSIFHIKQGESGEVIKEGKYAIEFSSDVTPDQRMNLRFLAEPAVDFTVKVNKVNPDGTLTDDESSFYAGSNMILDVKLVQSESQKPIPMDKVDKDIFEITSMVDNQKLPLIWNKKRNTFSTTFQLSGKEKVNADVKVQIEGLYQKEKSIQFMGRLARKFELKRVDYGEWNAKVDELEKGMPIEVIPLVNGKEMSTEELSELFANVTAKSAGHRIDYQLSQRSNRILIKPEKQGPTLSTSTGTIPVQVALTGQSPTEYAALDFDIFIEDVPWYVRYGTYLIILIVLVVLSILIYGIIRKPRFANERISMQYERYLVISGQKIPQGQPSIENFKTNFMERWLIPFKPEQKSIHGLLFKATENPDQIRLTSSSQHSTMIVAGTELGDDSGKKDIRLYSNDEIKIEEQPNIEIYTLRTN